MPLKVDLIDENGTAETFYFGMPQFADGWALMERCARLAEKYPKFNATFLDVSEEEATSKKVALAIVNNRLRNK